jgi:hypothetical protein
VFVVETEQRKFCKKVSVTVLVQGKKMSSLLKCVKVMLNNVALVVQ